jgi:hypothetical protein
MRWWREDVRLTRGTAAVISLFIGSLAGAGLYFSVIAFDRASDARERLEGEVDRLDRLENPTRRQLRRFLDKLVGEATPQQLRQLERIVGQRIGSPRPANPGRGGAPPATAPTPDRRRGAIPPATPPTTTPGRAPAATEVPLPAGPPAPPAERPQDRRPIVDIPPLDLDGPDGIVPPIDVPPVALPKL